MLKIVGEEKLILSPLECPTNHFFVLVRTVNKPKHQDVWVMFRFVLCHYENIVLDLELKLSGAGTNRNEPKWRSTRQKRQITAKQCLFCIQGLFFGSTETPNRAVSLFRQTTKTSLFVSDSVKTSFCSSLWCFNMSQVLYNTLPWGDGVGLKFCVSTVVSHPNLFVSVQLKLRN